MRAHRNKLAWIRFRFFEILLSIDSTMQCERSGFRCGSLDCLVFTLSTDLSFCFYMANPWMVLLSPALLLVAMVAHAAAQSKRTDQIIALAVDIQTSMERGGASRVQINDAICLAALGDGYDLGLDWDLKQLIQSFILPDLGLLASSDSVFTHSGFDSSAFKQHQKDCAEIDNKIESSIEYSRMRGAYK